MIKTQTYESSKNLNDYDIKSSAKIYRHKQNQIEVEFVSGWSFMNHRLRLIKSLPARNSSSLLKLFACEDEENLAEDARFELALPFNG